MSQNRIWVKLIASLALIYMIWLVVNCPCDNVLCCHLGRFWIALFIVIGIVFYENGWKAITLEC